jgi:hypothetical protein
MNSPTQVLLSPERGTKLWRSGDQDFQIDFSIKSGSIKVVLNETLMIMGTLISPIDHLGIISVKNHFKVTIPPKTEYMVINTSQAELELKFSEDPKQHLMLYDPYLYENKAQPDFNPDQFQKAHPVPAGYVDTLPKWYSIKYTYPAHNLIFVRPGLGISMQTHKQREEHWEILQGSPIIISDHNVT